MTIALALVLLLTQAKAGGHAGKRPAASEARRAKGDNGASKGETAKGDEDKAPKTLKTKVYTFGALDVEGKLKTPQLLYFLNRIKLELETSTPDKRSFMKELEQSTDDKNL